MSQALRKSRADATTSAELGASAARADQILGFAAIAMLAVILTAVMRGHRHWSEPPMTVWGHLALLLPVLALTPVMLIRPKATRSHRVLGYAWVGLLLAIAIEGFFIPLGKGRIVSPIWLISLLVLIQAPRLVIQARRHEIARHRRSVRGLVIGAFLVAGFFTLPFGRTLGVWLTQG